jgi:hypothetical protein
MIEAKTPWEDERCKHEEGGQRCTGIQIGEDAKCFAHTHDEAAQKRALASLHSGADLDFTRGVPFTEGLLSQILEGAPVEDGGPLLTNPDFTLATFSEAAWFKGATFSGDAEFTGATFSGDAEFTGATFSGDALFTDATFSGDAWFHDSTFSGAALFNYATFSEAALFTRATFSGDAEFTGTFSGDAWFTGATFSGDAWVNDSTFSGSAGFTDSTFSGDAWFNDSTISGDALFTDATFEKARQFGPCLTLGVVSFEAADFLENVDIEVSSNRLSCERSKFRDGATLRIRWSVVSLDDADFSRPCLLTWAPKSHHPLEIVLPGLVLAPPSEPPPESRPRIVSLRRANVTSLALSAVDLSACRFAGAHGLDQLTIEGKRQFADQPRRWHKQFGWPPVWRWTVRRAIAEEHEWRHKYERGIRKEGWYPHECQPPLPKDIDPLPDADIQNIYRDLRKGREDSKDEPGAADFYYGEMEMRRHATPRSFERVLLSIYWLVSGYGLRGWRALAALGVLVIALGVLFQHFGFKGAHPSFWTSFVYTAETMFSIQSTNEGLQKLYATGEVLRIVLRISGPVLLGLALLSIRNRVKR